MQEYENLDKRMALLEQKLDLLMENHLKHLQDDMNSIKKFLLGIGAVVAIEAGVIIAKFNGMM